MLATGGSGRLCLWAPVHKTLRSDRSRQTLDASDRLSFVTSTKAKRPISTTTNTHGHQGGIDAVHDVGECRQPWRAPQSDEEAKAQRAPGRGVRAPPPRSPLARPRPQRRRRAPPSRPSRPRRRPPPPPPPPRRRPWPPSSQGPRRHPRDHGTGDATDHKDQQDPTKHGRGDVWCVLLCCVLRVAYRVLSCVVCRVVCVVKRLTSVDSCMLYPVGCLVCPVN